MTAHPGLCPFIPVTRFSSGESACWPLEVWSRMQSVGVLYWLQLGVGAPQAPQIALFSDPRGENNLIVVPMLTPNLPPHLI